MPQDPSDYAGRQVADQTRTDIASRRQAQDDGVVVREIYRPELQPIKIQLNPSPEAGALEWMQVQQAIHAAVLKVLAVDKEGVELGKLVR